MSPISTLRSSGHSLTDRHHGQERRKSSVGLATLMSLKPLLATVDRPRQQTVAPSSVTAVSGLEYLQPGLPAAALFVLVPNLGCDVLAALWVSSSDRDLLSLFSGSLQPLSPFQCQSPPFLSSLSSSAFLPPDPTTLSGPLLLRLRAAGAHQGHHSADSFRVLPAQVTVLEAGRRDLLLGQTLQQAMWVRGAERARHPEYS